MFPENTTTQARLLAYKHSATAVHAFANLHFPHKAAKGEKKTEGWLREERQSKVKEIKRSREGMKRRRDV